MNFERFIAKRFMPRSKDGGGFSGPLSVIAVASIALGVLVMVMAVSILRGFQGEIAGKVVGFGSHLTVSNYAINPNYQEQPVTIDNALAATLRSTPGVKHLQSFATKGGMVKTKEQIYGILLRGLSADYDTSFRNNYSNVFENEYFLGTVGDGPCGDHTTRGYDFFNSVIEYNERNPENPIRHVAGTVDPFNEETDVLMFRPVDSTYFNKHPNIDAIVAFNAGSFVYPSMVSAGVADTMKLFAAGYNDGDDAVFGSKGAYQQEMVCAVESITYPLVLLLNKIYGVSFPDQPATAERRDCSTLIINSDEDLAKFKSCIYLSFKPEDAFLSPEDVLNLCAFANPDATYADLCAILDHMTIEDIK